MKKIYSLAGFIALLFIASLSNAQTVVYNNDFTGSTTGGYTIGGTPSVSFMPNTSSSASGVGYAGCYVSTTISSSWAITPNQLTPWVDMLFFGTNNGHYNQAGALSTFSAPFSPTLSSNTGVVEWTVNMRTISAQTGFATGQDGVVTILASTSGFCATGSGYAVTFDPFVAGGSAIRLVKYTGGLTGTVTSIISSSMPTLSSPTNYASIRVTYTPFTNRWTLDVRDDGPTMFSDPSTGTLSPVGNIIDATYTGSAMSYFGFHANYSVYSPTTCCAVKYAYFDNFRVSVHCANITGANEVCTGNTSLLISDVAGGTWSSAPASIATIDPSGLLHGISPGTAIVTYTTGTCFETTTVTVNALPAPITGTLEVCEGLATTLGNTTTGGSWSSDAIATATVDATGVATGIAAGTSNISYTLSTGCTTTATLTVNPTPTAITGTLAVCEGLTTSLSSAPSGGTWTSSAGTVATIDAAGVVTGITPGTSTISYALPTGCFVTTNATVNPLPNAGVVTGTFTVCPMMVTALSSTGNPGGTWTSGNTARAIVDAVTGMVTAVSAGTSTISYTVVNSCGSATATAVVTVNPNPSVGAITGTATVCATSTATLNNAVGGGVWSSTNPAIGTVNASGVVTGIAAGTTMISYAVTNSCGTATATRVVTVNPLPNAGAIIGSSTCPSGSITLTSPTGNPGGVWTSGNTSVATINSSSGLVNGVSFGTTVISYSVTNVCGSTSTSIVFTVNASPNAGTITGPSTVCVASTITLSDGVSGGVWTSSTPARATINTSGLVSGVSAGTTTISYSVTNVCGTAVATKVVTVNPLPNAGSITGLFLTCPGSVTSLADAVSGGTWNSSVPGVATVNASGVVSGVSAGTTVISYSVTNVCGTAVTTRTITVNPLPSPISGAGSVCAGSVTTLSSADPGGTWTASNANVSAGYLSGAITGLASGTVDITYTLPTGCFVTMPFTVNALPAPYSVTGGGSYCPGGTGVNIGLSGSDPGITYQLFSAGTPVGSPMAGTGSALNFGLVTPAGTYTIVAANSTTFCFAPMTGSAVVSIGSFVVPSVGISTSYSGSVCNGSAATFTANPVNGGTSPTFQWAVNGSVVGSSSSYSYVPANGDVVSVVLFPAGSICVLPATATGTHTVTVAPMGTPSVAISSSPAGTVCPGSAVTFAATSTSFAGATPLFVWIKNGINVGMSSAYTYVPANGDVVYSKMVSNYACRLADTAVSNTVITSVYAVPAPVVVITGVPGTTVAPGQTLTLTANTSGGTASKLYQWFVNGVLIPGATNNTYASSSFVDGSLVSCRVANTDACANYKESAMTVYVRKLGIEAIDSQALNAHIYPNPNDGTFAINVSSAVQEEATVVVTNMLGQKVKELSVGTNKEIEVRLEIPGIYNVTIFTTQGTESIKVNVR